MRLRSIGASLGLGSLLLSSCSADTNSLLGITDDKLDSFTCEMVMSDLNYANDALSDANDYYDYIGLEVVFDMLGDSLDIYAVSEQGEPAQWLKDLADDADEIGDVFGEFGEEDFDSDDLRPVLDSFKKNLGQISTYCD